MITLVDWLVGLIVGKALAEQHRKWLVARETRQTPLGESHGGKSTVAVIIRACSETDQTASSDSNGPSPSSAVLSSSEPLTEALAPMTTTRSDRISRSSPKISVFSSTESMISKPTVYMTLPERHHSCVVSHHSISSIPIGDDSLDALAIMQCCDNILTGKSLDISGIGFRPSTEPHQVRIPVPSSKEPMKASATSKKLAKEIEPEMRRRTILQQQETFLAEARELQKRRAIQERKARRKQQFPPPPFVPPVANAAELKEANQTDLIFFPTVADEGELCPAWDVEDFIKAAHPDPQIGSSKEQSPNRPVLPRIKQLKNMAKKLKGSGKQGARAGPSKLAQPKRPSLPASKKDLERKVFETIQDCSEPGEERDEGSGKGKARCIEG
ncbi:hypothetical protein ABVK25_007891 [Lepraria finkii]|uniref:Uncharacterized protein n=1 Tax=Lepraria finkii TaxID=1340010 RepID=A0ABR4B2C4_9LECA